MKRVAIVGGGYAGTHMARALDASCDVVMIERKDAFVHNVASIRAVVDPAWLDRLIIPYDRLMRRGRVLRDRVIAIESGGLKLESHGNLESDVTVVATGSSYAQPFKCAGDSIADFRTDLKNIHARLKASHDVTIVGAGAVGVELAGEIAAGMPGKHIDLISSSPSLFPEFPDALGRKLRAGLLALNVDLHNNVRAEGLKSLVSPSVGPVRIAGNGQIEADIVFPVIGAKPNNTLLKTLPSVAFEHSGRVVVDGWLRPAGMKNVFAIGDVAATGDNMTIVAISRQVPWLTKVLNSTFAGYSLEDLPQYQPQRSPLIVVPLGPKGGATVLPLTKTGVMVGSFATSLIKGKSLFVPRYRKEFGLTYQRERQ